MGRLPCWEARLESSIVPRSVSAALGLKVKKATTVIVLLTAVVLSGQRSAEASETAPELSRYVRRLWTVADGLPQNGVLSISQTPNGFLYLGTRAGLARFDGLQFEVFDRRSAEWLADHFITALAACPDGALLVGTRDGLGLIRESAGSRRTLGDKQPANYVRSLLHAEDGSTWVGTYGGGIVRIQGENLVSYDTKNGLPDLFVRPLVEGANGEIWAGSTNGAVRFRGDQIQSYGAEEGLTNTLDTYGHARGDECLREVSQAFGLGCPPGWRSRCKIRWRGVCSTAS